MSKSNCFVIGISGTTNGGKTTLASMLCKALPGSICIGQDTYFKEPNDPRVETEENGFQNWEKLSALNMDEMMIDVRRSIKELENGPSPSFLIVEGFIIFNHRELANLIDKKYFISIDYDTCYSRRKFRTYNPPDPPGYFDNIVWPMYLKNMADLKDQTDIEYIVGDSDLDTLFHNVFSTVRQLAAQRRVEQASSSTAATIE